MIVRKWTLFLILTAFMTGAAGCGMMSGKKTVKLEEVPPAARAVIETYTEGAEIGSIKAKHKEGKHVYKVCYKKDGRDFELKVTEAGDVEEWEKHVTMDELPGAVRATVEQETGGAKIEELVQETEDGKMFYEVEFEKDGKEHEVKIAEDGSILEREME